MTHFEAIEKHLSQFVEEDMITVFHEKKSPDFHLDVYLIKPDQFRSYYILLTNGISLNPMHVPRKTINPYIELSILLPETWKFDRASLKKNHYYWPIRELKSTGRYIHREKTWLREGHLVMVDADSTIGDTAFRGHLIIESITLPDEFCEITWEEDTINVLTLMPLYKEELKHKHSYGLRSLYKRFAENGVLDIVDVNRVNVCKKPGTL